MDLEFLRQLDDAALIAEFRRLSRSQMDDEFKMLNAQRSLLSQKLEALYSPGREDLFVALRPGGLEEIDKALQSAAPEAIKERSLLKTYRDVNRVLLHFMDAYEGHVLGELKYLSQEELQMLYGRVGEQLRAAAEILKNPNSDYRKAQDASGTIRLCGLFKNEILTQLRDRFNKTPEDFSKDH